MGVLNASVISVDGRIVSVGFDPVVDEGGVIDDRNRGHSCIALDSVFKRNGRYVNLVYWCDGGSSDDPGAGYSDEGSTSNGRVDFDDAGR